MKVVIDTNHSKATLIINHLAQVLKVQNCKYSFRHCLLRRRGTFCFWIRKSQEAYQSYEIKQKSEVIIERKVVEVIVSRSNVLYNYLCNFYTKIEHKRMNSKGTKAGLTLQLGNILTQILIDIWVYFLKANILITSKYWVISKVNLYVFYMYYSIQDFSVFIW